MNTNANSFTAATCRLTDESQFPICDISRRTRKRRIAIIGILLALFAAVIVAMIIRHPRSFHSQQVRHDRVMFANALFKESRLLITVEVESITQSCQEVRLDSHLESPSHFEKATTVHALYVDGLVVRNGTFRSKSPIFAVLPVAGNPCVLFSDSAGGVAFSKEADIQLTAAEVRGFKKSLGLQSDFLSKSGWHRLDWETMGFIDEGYSRRFEIPLGTRTVVMDIRQSRSETPRVGSLKTTAPTTVVVAYLDDVPIEIANVFQGDVVAPLGGGTEMGSSLK